MRSRKIQPPLTVGLMLLRHRLAADQLQRKLARIQQIHAASLRDGAALVIQAAQQEAPEPRGTEASTNRKLSQGVHGGRSKECA